MGRLLPISFVDGGRDWQGVDCWGLVCLVYRELSQIDLPLYGEVSADDLRDVSRKIDAGKNGWQMVDRPRMMDVAVLRLPSSSRIGHVGLYDGQGRILHAERASGVALEDMRSPMIAARLIGFWRY